MKKIFYFSVFLLLSIISIPVLSQQIYKGQVNVASGEMRHEGDSLYVHMIVDLSDLKLDRNRSLTLTPVLSDNMHQVEFPDILINGTTKDKAYQRSQALGGEQYRNESAYTVIKLDKKANRKLYYRNSLRYEKWMDSAQLYMKEDLCGCGGYAQETAMTPIIGNIIQPPVPYEMILQVAYIQPKVEEVKVRSEQWETYLDFPVNKTEIQSAYMNNPSELAKIESVLKTVRADNNLTVTRIDIKGYASPEGPVANNQRLSEGRAESFRKYLLSKLDFPASIYNVSYEGENWDGLEDAVEASTMPDKDAVIDIISNTNDVESRKNKLKQLNGGATYQQTLKEIYPKLRKVVSLAHYNVKNFSVDEAKEEIKTHPQRLSLDEMFCVSNTYQMGSEDFIDVFETAVRMFPNDATANLNAAAAALSANNTEKAQKYLLKADSDTPEYTNNIGVLYFLNGDLDRAKNEFSKAAQGGSGVAAYNLKEIEKKIANDMLIRK